MDVKCKDFFICNIQWGKLDKMKFKDENLYWRALHERCGLHNEFCEKFYEKAIGKKRSWFLKKMNHLK